MIVRLRWNVPEFQRMLFEQLGLDRIRADRVLDIGCGDGTYAEWISRRANSTIGVDLATHPNWDQLGNARLKFERQDARKLTFADGSFDVVFLKDVLHHSDSPKAVLLEARRVAAQGGRVYVVEANRLNPISYVHMTLMLGHQHFRRPVFRRLVQSVFPDAHFIGFEAHVYPFWSRGMIRAAERLQTLISRAPVIERFASYNAAESTV
jgi:ubiquinone/menaquinone biosynthesis C-methylase UbiE